MELITAKDNSSFVFVQLLIGKLRKLYTEDEHNPGEVSVRELRYSQTPLYRLAIVDPAPDVSREFVVRDDFHSWLFRVTGRVTNPNTGG